jgi:hypothetical protein
MTPRPTSTTGAAQQPQQQIADDLQRLTSVKEMREYAAALGVDQDVIEEARDSDDQRASLVLLIQQHSTGPPELQNSFMPVLAASSDSASVVIPELQPQPEPAALCSTGDPESLTRQKSFGDLALERRAMQSDSPAKPATLYSGYLEKKGGQHAIDENNMYVKSRNFAKGGRRNWKQKWFILYEDGR